MKSSGQSDYEYKSVSGAWIKQPKFYCTYHKAYLTQKQAAAHHCFNKHNKGVCYRLYTLDRKGIRVNQEQKLQSTMDKILRTLTHIDMNIGRLQRDVHNLQNESKNIDMKKFEDDGK